MSADLPHDETESVGRDRDLIDQARRQAERVGKQVLVSVRPERVDPYKILEVLGEGGMGVVYLAEQTEPIRRRVALKLIKLGMDTKQVIARFESERQALAMETGWQILSPRTHTIGDSNPQIGVVK